MLRGLCEVLTVQAHAGKAQLCGGIAIFSGPAVVLRGLCEVLRNSIAMLKQLRKLPRRLRVTALRRCGIEAHSLRQILRDALACRQDVSKLSLSIRAALLCELPEPGQIA